MRILSPITLKRLAAFRRIRRAWWSLWAFVGVFLFCLAAEWVCPCDPRAVVDASELEPYRRETVRRVYNVRAARYNVDADGTVWDFEGPDDVATAVAADPSGASLAGEFEVVRRARNGYARCCLKPRVPAPAIERKVGLEPVAFPFRPCPGHPFGIDSGGHDVYARVVHGMRLGLIFGIALALSGLLIGLVIGAVEGYFGGVTDLVLQRFTEIWSAIPFLYVMIFIGSTLGRGFAILLVSYAVFNWIAVSYYVRAEFLRLRSRAFVESAKVLGLSSPRIIFRHILPNALTPLVTLFPFLLMGAIGLLAALDFLGFGLPPLTPSCGELLQQAQQFRDAWWLILFPSLALFTVMLLTVLIGEGLREAFDPRRRSVIAG